MKRWIVLLLSTCTLAAEELTGKLVVPPEAGTKASYTTGNFQLLGSKGKFILTESKQVSAQKLSGFKDQWVTIQAELQPAQAPDPQEQAPLDMGPDGSATPRPHPASYRVLSIRASKGPKLSPQR